MEQWLEWSRGPVFRFAILLMALGIIRILILNILNIRHMLKRAGNKRVAYRYIFRESLRWLFPRGKIAALDRNRGIDQAVFTVLSILFHATLIITPLFLADHLRLLEQSIGISWPGLGRGLADGMTLGFMVLALVLLVRRLFTVTGRSLSRAQDYFLLILLFGVFVTGFLASHPACNPMAYNTTLFLHVMAGNLVLVLIPFSKLSHVVLFPFTQLISELGWHLDPDSGRNVGLALGKENEPI